MSEAVQLGKLRPGQKFAIRLATQREDKGEWIESKPLHGTVVAKTPGRVIVQIENTMVEIELKSARTGKSKKFQVGKVSRQEWPGDTLVEAV
ncbi:MAG TPA: hypothetical protein VFA71_03985 [Terriglobales bacterium]|nr:hypothetical protein [Terriglobales bacterium]